MSTQDGFVVGTRETRNTCVTVQLGPPPDDDYAQVVLRIPGICNVRLAGPDAQRLGNALVRAGGGVTA